MTRQRIAICGGGMAGLTAAFELTAAPDWRDHREVTVYQAGWLLGGKGASVRNRRAHDRVEEHGLHLWMGSYRNAFALVRQVYDELARPAGAPLATCAAAFRAQDFVVLEEPTAAGWRHWRFETPQNGGVPGAPDERATTTDYLRMAVDWLVQVLVHWSHADNGSYASRAAHARAALRDLRLVRAAVAASAAAAAMTVRRVLQSLRPAAGVDAVDDRPADEALNSRWLWFTIDFVGTHVIGLLRDGLIGEDADLDRVDHEDYRAWLLRHGASRETVEAPPVRALYTLAFSHDDGIAASVAIPTMFRMMLGYQGAILYRMAAGMGETIFAPLYEVLARRGVRFEFFHQLEQLEVSADGRDVATLRFAVQATCAAPYQPLIAIDGLPCWPEAPLWEQLDEGAALAPQVAGWAFPGGPRVAERALWLGRDFDQVILAIPAPALPSICAPLCAREPRWRTMLATLRSIPTQAVQLWLDRDARALGWQMPPPVVGTYARPLDTWCDMTHLLEVERWSNARLPQHVAYFCGQHGSSADPAPADPAAAAVERAASAAACRRWLDTALAHLLPGACDAAGRVDEARVVDLYQRCNVAPADRYVLAAPGTGRARLPAHDTGFANLAIAGDWIKTGLDVGCIEAATMAGRQAARAIDRRPRDIPGEPRAFAAHFHALARRPRFVERHYDLLYAPPYHHHDVDMHAFFLRADPGRLRALVDRTLNAPAAGAVRYVPAAPLVVLGCAFVDAIYPSAPVGHVGEIDIAFWVPLLATGARGRRRLVWFMPWVFVDNPAATAIGREVYGFPKLTCAIHHERDAAGLAALEVRGHALARFAPETRAEVRTIIDVRRRPGGAPRPGAGRLAPLAARLLGTAQLGLDAALRPAAVAAGAALPIVFLRQLRDLAEPEVAAYQAIVEAPARLTAYRGATWGGDEHDLTVLDCASLPLVSELGLEGPRPRPLLCSRARFDFVMERGHEVWRAGAAPDQRIAPARAASASAHSG